METEFRPLGCAVVTVSDSRTLASDLSGDLLSERLSEAGHRLVDRCLLRDDRAELVVGFRQRIARPDVAVLISTGGSGVTGRDVTPEAAAALFTKPIPGFGELFRWLSYGEIGAATIQSRAQAGLAGDTLVFNLPGSSGACRLALDSIILPQLDCRTQPCNFAELLPRFGE